MNYWLDCFTGTTWEEFRRAGSQTTGFNERFRKYAGKIMPGDVLLAYLVGVKRWVGALKVTGTSSDTRKIWSLSDFPVRFTVQSLVQLDPEIGVPMDQLEGRVDFFCGPEHRIGYKGFVRRSPNLFRRPDDGLLILGLLKEAEAKPISRPVDQKKLRHKPLFHAEQRRGKNVISTVVSVPEPEEDLSRGEDKTVKVTETSGGTRHTEIQFHLLNLGALMGLEIWVARNDRSRIWNNQALASLAGMVTDLPTQFNEATNRTIELIDVLWLKGNSIVAAFEVECTTSIYSGLLRMSDLLALQPNLDINLYLVAPDERRDKVEAEILRPTFKLRDKPLSEVCGFLAFSSLMEKVEGIIKLGLGPSLKPDFLEHLAEYFEEPRDED